MTTLSSSFPAPRSFLPPFEHVDAHRDAFIGRLFAYLWMPSISAHGTGVEETADVQGGLVGGMGLAVEWPETLVWPVIGDRQSGPARTPTVLRYGHHDVQPPEPIELWASPPFGLEIRDGRMYARGAGEHGGPLQGSSAV